MFHLLPLLGAGILFLMALFLAKPEKNDDGETIRPNITAGFVFAFFGFGMIFVGMVGSAIEPIVDLDLIDTVFGEASLVYVAYGVALGAMGGLVYWAPKLWGHTLDMKKVAPLALLGVLATVLASFPHYIAGFLDQPAGLVYDDSDLQIWNILVLVGHGLMALTVLAFIGLLMATVLGSEPDATTIRSTVTRSSGPPRRRLPRRTSSTSPRSPRPSRCSTSRPPMTRTQGVRADGSSSGRPRAGTAQPVDRRRHADRARHDDADRWHVGHLGRQAFRRHRGRPDLASQRHHGSRGAEQRDAHRLPGAVFVRPVGCVGVEAQRSCEHRVRPRRARHSSPC